MNIPSDIQICNATASNWRRLNAKSQGKLTSRANKTLSERRVIAAGYGRTAKAKAWLAMAQDMEGTVEEVMSELCRKALAEPSAVSGDVLGFVYQSLRTEGERNRAGIYYTHEAVTKRMLQGVYIKAGERFLDPCCGSGAFLLGVEAENPESLYGFDADPIAVMIARTNLRIKYHNCDFTPNIYCTDFLSMEDVPQAQYDYIYTNPPWGTDKMRLYACPPLRSHEKASMFLFRALQWIKPEGHLNFLLPTSLFKVKTHADIRSYLLHNTRIEDIIRFDRRFDGVFTDFVSIRLRPGGSGEQHYDVHDGCIQERIDITSVTAAMTDIPLEPVNPLSLSIIDKMERLRYDDLSHSRWALGIVTGNNKEKLKSSPNPMLEPVYSGKQVYPFVMKPATYYVRFSPEEFQQCAKEELYRAPEKLVYRFIANRPVVAYDDGRNLCLNSANVIIPDVKGCSVKSAAALLNSSLYGFYYSAICKDIKVLKSQLGRLPFPQLTTKQDETLASIVDGARAYGFNQALQHQLNNYVYSLFGISETERKHIEKQQNR